MRVDMSWGTKLRGLVVVSLVFGYIKGGSVQLVFPDAGLEGLGSVVL